MTVDQLLSAIRKDCKMQVNIHTDEGTLVFIPDAAYYQERRHWATMQRVGALVVHSLNVEMEDADEQPVLLMIINENT